MGPLLSAIMVPIWPFTIDLMIFYLGPPFLGILHVHAWILGLVMITIIPHRDLLSRAIEKHDEPVAAQRTRRSFLGWTRGSYAEGPNSRMLRTRMLLPNRRRFGFCPCNCSS